MFNEIQPFYAFVMKINEKNLIAIASATNVAVDKEGWLNKKSETQKNFQKRYCILKGNLLFYFEKKSEKEPVGLVIVEGCTVELAEDDQPFSFKLVFHGQGDRSYTFSAESQEELESWMKSLACASYDYVKLMVAELQKQVDELTELEKAKQFGTNGTFLSAVPGLTNVNSARHNPFNTSTLPNTKIKRVLTFAEIHCEYGQKIIQARSEWLKKQPKTSDIHQDLLIVL